MGIIEFCYYDYIISNIEKMGFYIIFVLGLVMLYVCLEEGVIKIFFVLVIFVELVIFEGEDEFVSVFIIFVGSDFDCYMEGLMEII